MSSEKTRYVGMNVSRLASNVCMLPSAMKIFISVEERESCIYVTDTLGPLKDCYVEHCLCDEHIDPLWKQTERNESYEEVE